MVKDFLPTPHPVAGERPNPTAKSTSDALNKLAPPCQPGVGGVAAGRAVGVRAGERGCLHMPHLVLFPPKHAGLGVQKSLVAYTTPWGVGGEGGRGRGSERTRLRLWS